MKGLCRTMKKMKRRNGSRSPAVGWAAQQLFVYHGDSGTSGNIR